MLPSLATQGNITSNNVSCQVFRLFYARAKKRERSERGHAGVGVGLRAKRARFALASSSFAYQLNGIKIREKRGV